MYPAGRQGPVREPGSFPWGIMAKNPDDKDQTLPKSQGEKEKPEKPGKGSKAQNAADRP